MCLSLFALAAAGVLSLCTCSGHLTRPPHSKTFQSASPERRCLTGRLEPPVRCSQTVKSLPTLIAIWIAVYGGDAIADCPVGYPDGFPCVSGGTFISVPSPAAQPVVPNEFYVLRYDQAAKALFGSVLNEAANAAWVVEAQSEAEEPGGLRYRALLRRSEQAVSISVVSKPEGSYLLVVKRLPK